MPENDDFYMPVILGTVRKGRKSEMVAKLMHTQLEKHPAVTSELIDIRSLPIVTDDAGTSIRMPQFSEKMVRADGVVIVVPEYNHGYPGMLKHVLDTLKKELIHKAAGLAGVSSGLISGARAIDSLLPVLRELGLVVIRTDLSFGRVQERFDDAGNFIDEAYLSRVETFINELVWMARVMRHGRENS